MALEVSIKKRLSLFDLDVSFVAENETVALLGASGCGKSMTLKCIAGIEKPDSGRIVLNGRVLFDSEKKINLPPQKRRVGYLFQQYALFPNMTVRQNIAAGARGKKDTDGKIDGLIKTFHLEGLENKRPNQLSGGQQQRTALARILANEPEILLLDEPFSALDSYLRWELEMQLKDTLETYGGTAVFVSHNRDEVYHLCSSVCVINDGRSEEKEAVKELYASPKTLSACILSGCRNVSSIERRGDGTVFASDWGVELHPAGEVRSEHCYVGVRSGSVRPVRDGEKPENAFLCTAERVVEDVHRYSIILATPGGREGRSCIRMETSKKNGEKVKTGDKLLIYIEPADIILLRK